MTKCGKGCMPECEYFTTGGCISPFNCMYKIETGYINSATSTPNNLTDLLVEFDEMGFAPTTPCPDSEKYAIEWREKVRTEFERLEAENAELKETLEKAVELPRIIHPNSYEWHIQYQYESGIITYDIRYSETEAETRLAELKKIYNQ